MPDRSFAGPAGLLSDHHRGAAAFRTQDDTSAAVEGRQIAFRRFLLAYSQYAPFLLRT